MIEDGEAPFRLAVFWQRPPTLSPADDQGSGVFDAAENWVFYLTHNKHHYRIVVPEGFRCDGPSVPWIAQWAVKVSGNTWAAGLIHDVGYSTRGFDGKIPKDAWDKYFGMALSMCDVPPLKTALMFEAVYRLGGYSWANKSKIDVYNEANGLLPTYKRVVLTLAAEELMA